ncbi:NAD(P)/FAD-dependent oxidoreductase [Chromobacterium sphagni]|uniref:FAD/NAD(P)-binding domain-containing protein n=1 Tax=Chromobacterium sphagni TaxID=1903179 RepID=A0A1S1X2G3_9NEIS|nr:FAD-dependent oxidoreductase [Chromobacterium sphagni]OHX13717.1 hypothetical protein BI347_09460 [Chromobacterium sphagni]OHX18092.1 hypothetical protein BI344_11175 [Chromobacterium sphagni]
MTTLPPPPARILILGGGYAGLCLARRLAHPAMPPSDITLLDASSHWQERIRLHQVAAGQNLPRFDYQQTLAPLGIRFVQAVASAIHPHARRVEAQTPAGEALELEYDYLALTLGSHIAQDPALADPQLLPLDSPIQAAILHRHLQAQPDARVLIVGGGLSGLESAFEIADAWPRASVTLADAGRLAASSQPGGLSHQAVDYLIQSARQKRIDWLQDARVIASQDGTARFERGGTLDFDIGLISAGFAPSPLARAAGLSVNARGQALVDASLASVGHPEILAAGDCAAIATAESGPCRMSCAAALPAAVGIANTLRARLLGQPAPDYVFRYVFRCLSLGRNDGLIQFVDSHDAPTRQVWTGIEAARWKEFICQRTLATLGLAETPHQPQLPPLAVMPRLLQMQSFFAEPA